MVADGSGFHDLKFPHADVSQRCCDQPCVQRQVTTGLSLWGNFCLLQTLLLQQLVAGGGVGGEIEYAVNNTVKMN